MFCRRKGRFFYSVVDPNTWNLDQDPDLELWAQFGSGSKDYVMLLSFEKSEKLFQKKTNSWKKSFLKL